MQLTLLELIQRVLSSVKGEEVDNYDDTAESLVVRDIIKECYYTLISSKDFPELKTLFELNASGDPTKPTLMTMPSDVVGLEWVKYNKILLGNTDASYEYVYYLPMREFLDQIDGYNDDETYIGSFSVTTGSADTIEFKYKSDHAPMYYTSFNDSTLIFDSYDSAIDTTLQKTKTKCYGLKSSTWTNSNNFTLPLDSQQFDILLKEAKAMAWMELRQTENIKAEREARRAKIQAEKKKDRVNYNAKGDYYTRYPDYGRRGSGYGYSRRGFHSY